MHFRLASSPRVHFGLLLALGVLAIWIGAGLAALETRRAELMAWSVNASSTSLTVAAYVGKTLVVGELVLQAMIDRLRSDDVDDEVQYQSLAGSRPYYDFLKQRTENLQQIDVATFIARDGRVLNFSRSYPPPPINLSDRDYFKAQVEPDAPAVSLGRSVRNRGTGKWTFYLARRVTSPSGKILGVVIIGIEADYLSSFFKEAVEAHGIGISFLKNDGTLLAATFPSDRLGETLQLDPRLRAAIENPTGILLDTPSPARPDAASRRLVAPRPLGTFPGFVVVSIPENLVLSRWHRTVLWIVVAAGAASLLLIGAALLLERASTLMARLVADTKEEDVLRAALDTPAALAAIVDPAGRFTYRNETFRRILGSRASLGELLPAGEMATALTVTDGEESAEIEVAAKADDSRNRLFRFWLSPLPAGNDRQGMILIGHDETRRRSEETAIAQSAKLITLGEMATSMAHELNQPLNVIKMAVQSARYEVEEALAGGGDSGEPMAWGELLRFVDSKLDRVEQQVERAAAIISHMRIFGRVPVEEPAVFDVRDACRGALALVGGMLRDLNVAVVENLGSAPLHVLGHQMKLEQVLINLISNARDALGAVRDQAARRIDLSAGKQDSKVVILVSDNGPGIPSDIRAHLFESFFTTKPAASGTGLGLAICATLVRDFGGSLVLLPEGPGAIFRIELPCAVETP